MSFRARLTLAVALAVAVAVAATSAITYVLVRNELRGQVDDALRERVSSVRLRVVTDPVTGEPQLDLPPDRFGGAAGITQLVTADGRRDPLPRRDRRPAGQRAGARRRRPATIDRSSPMRASPARISASTRSRSTTRGSRSRSRGRSRRSTPRSTGSECSCS